MSIKAKKTKIWNAASANGDLGEKKKTLKGLCEKIGLNYNTAKKGQPKNGERKMWVVGERAWTVWVEEVD